MWFGVEAAAWEGEVLLLFSRDFAWVVPLEPEMSSFTRRPVPEEQKVQGKAQPWELTCAELLGALRRHRTKQLMVVPPLNLHYFV